MLHVQSRLSKEKVFVPTRMSTEGSKPSVTPPEKKRKSSLGSELPLLPVPANRACQLCAHWFLALISASSLLPAPGIRYPSDFQCSWNGFSARCHLSPFHIVRTLRLEFYHPAVLHIITQGIIFSSRLSRQ